jgi:hypothetical protein
MEQIKSVKNAYINLFTTLGYTIKGADKMLLSATPKVGKY